MEQYQNPEEMARRVLSLLRKYNVMSQNQICAFFFGQEKAAARAIKKLEKNRQISRNPYTDFLSSSEFAYSMKDEGTIAALWVLVDMKRKKTVDNDYLAEKEDFPARIIFLSNQEIYDILYVGLGDVKLINGVFEQSRRPEGSHIVVVEDKSLIGQLRIPGSIGFCVVREDGEVEYYRKKDRDGK